MVASSDLDEQADLLAAQAKSARKEEKRRRALRLEQEEIMRVMPDPQERGLLDDTLGERWPGRQRGGRGGGGGGGAFSLRCCVCVPLPGWARRGHQFRSSRHSTPPQS